MRMIQVRETYIQLIRPREYSRQRLCTIYPVSKQFLLDEVFKLRKYSSDSSCISVALVQILILFS